MKAAFVFSGQGAQKVGMGKDLFEQCPAAAKVYAEADSVLGWNVSGLCFSGPEEKLTESRYCQVAIFVTSMACLAAFQEKFPLIRPVGAAGLSLGEYGALCCCGYFRFPDALRLVARRAELMDAACRAEAGTMASILTDGTTPPEVFARVCAECGIDVANFNSPAQTVISGTADGVAKASAILKEKEGVRRIIPLNVAGAYHSRMMTGAGEQLRPVLENVAVAKNEIPVAQNFTGAVTEDYTQIKENLVRQVAGSVRWVDCVRSLSALGADTFIEFGPGTVLTGLIRKIDASKTTWNVSSAEDLNKLELQ
ncbi:MAG: Polyketide biosynthesis protein BaeE [Lentisphaerae bacterium ADurb.Bin242]|nr:MAG: Polyketide biosynthesis protein BaeE [Lentisphaerae bacterium ADurb.Bin242]